MSVSKAQGSYIGPSEIGVQSGGRTWIRAQLELGEKTLWSSSVLGQITVGQREYMLGGSMLITLQVQRSVTGVLP